MATLFTVRCSRFVKLLQLVEPAQVISSWETKGEVAKMLAQGPGSGMFELNVWVKRPHTFRGIVADHNEQWPGLQIGIVREKENK